MDTGSGHSQMEVRPSKSRIPRLTLPEDGSLLAFSKACSKGDLEKVAEFIEGRNRPLDYLNHGFGPALRAGQMEVSRYLLSHGALIDGSVQRNALDSNSVDILQLLLDHGWDVNDAVGGGEVVLPYAVQNEPVLRWLLDKGGNPNLGKPVWGNIQPDSPSDTKSGEALNNAARLSSISALDLLLERGAKIEYAAPLHFAITSARPDAEAFAMVEHLLQLGVDINGTDDVQGPHGCGTPLHYAAGSGLLERVRFLLERGADPKKPRQGSGRKPIDEATKWCRGEVVEFLKGRERLRVSQMSVLPIRIAQNPFTSSFGRLKL